MKRYLVLLENLKKMPRPAVCGVSCECLADVLHWHMCDCLLDDGPNHSPVSMVDLAEIDVFLWELANHLASVLVSK